MITIPRVEDIVLLDGYSWRLEANQNGFGQLLPDARQHPFLYTLEDETLVTASDLISSLGTYLLCANYGVFEQRGEHFAFDLLTQTNKPVYTIMCSCVELLDRSTIEQKVTATGSGFGWLDGTDPDMPPYAADIRTLQVDAHTERFLANVEVQR